LYSGKGFVMMPDSDFFLPPQRSDLPW
jgi:hypothetical protein